MNNPEFPRAIETDVLRALAEFPVVAIVGPRQAGKSTLAHRILPRYPKSIHLDLELPSNLRRLSDPEAYLNQHTDYLVCIDEVQHSPELFAIMRALIDRDRRPGRFLILGSASPELLRQSTESLAGRIAYLHLSPFSIEELPAHLGRMEHWLRGGFPLSLLAPNEGASFRWREQFVRTYLDRDIPALGIDLTRSALERFWTMVASGNGSLLNKAKLAEPIGVSPKTIQRYLDILEATFMVRVHRPYLANVRKRLARSPKVYVRDSGVLHALLGIESWDDLYRHPSIGASWETYAIEQITSVLTDWHSYFYRTSGGAELDLVLEKAGRRIAVEMKASRSPRVTRGFYSAAEDIGAVERYVVAPLEEPDLYPIGDKTYVCTPDKLLKRLVG